MSLPRKESFFTLDGRIRPDHLAGIQIFLFFCHGES